MEPRYFSVSELLCFQTCPSLWAARYYHKRKLRREEADALDLGSAFHEGMEQQPKLLVCNTIWDVEEWRTYLELVLRENAEARGYEPKAETLRAIEPLAIQAAEWWAQPERNQEEVLWNETPLEFKLGFAQGKELRLRFKPDLVIANKHGVFHRQYKTIHSSKAIPDYVRLIKQSMHEAAYRYGLMEALDENGYDSSSYRGTDLVCFHKDSVHAQAKGERCSHCKDPKKPELGRAGYVYRHPRYVRQPLLVTEQHAADTLVKMRLLAIKIMAVIQDLDHQEYDWNGPSMFPAEHACFTRQRRLCWAFDACREKTLDLRDDRLYDDCDPDARYNELKESSSEST